ncbi:MAG: hypothetical protein PHN75_12010, partial [Syntrophales bacterium]|nr:hypothetical protein [Syntrophales bacterium]
MILDTRTIFLITFVNVLITSVGMLAAARAYEGHIRRSMAAWGWACFMVCTAWLLIGLRDLISPFLSIIAANALLHYGVAEFYQSFRLFDGKRPYRRYTNTVIMVLIILQVIFFYIQDNLAVRIIISSVVLIFLFALSAWTIILPAKGDSSVMRRFVGL